MLRRALLVSGVLLSGSLGFASVAGAQAVNADVNFTGTVPSACAFVLPSGATQYSGSLTTNQTNTQMTGTANISVNCTKGASLQLSNARGSENTPNSVANFTMDNTPAGVGTTTKTVNAEVTPPSGQSVLGAGSYDTSVTVTATPTP